MTTALTSYLYPNGKPEQPSEDDRAAAVAWVDAWPERDPTILPNWLANNRDKLIRMEAVARMQERRFREASELHPPKQQQPRRAA